jgi:hypothetical protein
MMLYHQTKNDTRYSTAMAHRLRSTIPGEDCVSMEIQIERMNFFFFIVFDVPVYDNRSTKPAPLHLSQVVNRVSRCNYVLRHLCTRSTEIFPETCSITLITRK